MWGQAGQPGQPSYATLDFDEEKWRKEGAAGMSKATFCVQEMTVSSKLKILVSSQHINENHLHWF